MKYNQNFICLRKKLYLINTKSEIEKLIIVTTELFDFEWRINNKYIIVGHTIRRIFINLKSLKIRGMHRRITCDLHLRFRNYICILLI